MRFVRYYLTITHTRWEQALSRAEQRGHRLHEALQGVRGNAQLVEELLAWLTEAQALLATKERDPIPDDITVVDALVKEHLEFHEDLNERSKEVDRVTQIGGQSAANKDAKRALHGRYARRLLPHPPTLLAAVAPLLPSSLVSFHSHVQAAVSVLF